MCGIVGILDINRATHETHLSGDARRMSATLRHRGPDDEGIWMDAAAGIALGHRRLSILDLTTSGHQPMVSSTGRYVVSFNGEIYNFLEIRRELEILGHRFRGRSDTEVLLEAVVEWGLLRALSHFNGMFAFALWDRAERSIHLVRDRLGEKPLYYGRFKNTVLFASELKALRQHPNFRADIDRGALALFLRHKYVPAPFSIYRGVFKLPPASVLTISAGSGSLPSPVEYWSLRDAAERGIAEPFDGTASDAVDELEELLCGAVGLRMVSDVPLGAFLSGGIDSSTIVALMQATSKGPVRTFTIGSTDPDYNEAEQAKAVAGHLGADHTELYVTPNDAMGVVPRLPDVYDEPFADSSQIPALLVSALARQHVTVSLSGDAGDELFGGYNRHLWVDRIWSGIGWLPSPVRVMAARTLRAVPPHSWDTLLHASRGLLPAAARVQSPGEKLHKLARILPARSPEAAYLSLVSHWQHPSAVVLDGSEPRTLLSDSSRFPRIPDRTSRMLFLDALTYLPDDILAKVDRASMSVGLEARVPFLDHRVVEFAWSLPSSMKIREGQSKWLLRRLLRRYVPDNLVEKPKMGFGVPIGSWLRHELRDWAEELLTPTRLQSEGFFDPRPIREAWVEHISERRNRQYELWDVLMFEAWLEHQHAGSKPVASAAGTALSDA
jgi:asparagine synthase (glutamine-hydrolysing)